MNKHVKEAIKWIDDNEQKTKEALRLKRTDKVAVPLLLLRLRRLRNLKGTEILAVLITTIRTITTLTIAKRK